MNPHIPQLHLVFPVYNEERQLEDSVLTTLHYLRSLNLLTFCIQIADNASTDRTGEIGRRLAQTHTEVAYLRIEEKGVGNALKAAWSKAPSPILGFMDIDLSTDLKHLQEALPLMLNNKADIVIGTRLHPKSKVIGRKVIREITSRGLNWILQHYVGVQFSDALCGFKFLKSSVFERLHRFGLESSEWFFEPELLIKAEWHGYHIAEVPVHWVDDPNSKVMVLDTVLKFLPLLRKMKMQRPRHAFQI